MSVNHPGGRLTNRTKIIPVTYTKVQHIVRHLIIKM